MSTALDAIKALAIVSGLFMLLVLSPIIVPWYCIFAYLRYRRTNKESNDEN